MSKAEGGLPKVNSQKEFMDYLDNVINPPKIEDYDVPSKGRLRELKSYILETNEDFPATIDSKNYHAETVDTGLNNLKILRVFGKDANKQRHVEFFLDISNKRFLTLHTNAESDETNRFIEMFVKDFKFSFDHAWFSSNMLKHIAKIQGNALKGFGVHYSNQFLKSENESDADIEDLNLEMTGSLANEVQDIIKKNPKVDRTIAYNKVRILRGKIGEIWDWVQDDLHHTGYFAVKKGKSVQDHLHLVDISKEEYAKSVKDIEDQRIGIKKVEDRTLVEGKSFDFVFKTPIEDITLFVDRFFNSASPFKLWGMKEKILDDYYKVVAVDLHTGNPIDFEISKDMMRAYLFKGSCGNTILRLLTNLQIYYDSYTQCDMLVYN